MTATTYFYTLCFNTVNITILFLEQFIEKCKVLSFYDNDDEIVLPTKLTEDLIKKTLEKNKITLPYKSPKLKLW